MENDELKSQITVNSIKKLRIKKEKIYWKYILF